MMYGAASAMQSCYEYEASLTQALSSLPIGQSLSDFGMLHETQISDFGHVTCSLAQVILPQPNT